MLSGMTNPVPPFPCRSASWGYIMRHLLKAIFDHQDDARRVLDALLAQGFAPADITLTDVCPRGPDDGAGGPADGTHAAGAVPSVMHATARLFGAGRHPMPAEQADTSVPGCHILALAVGSAADAKRAAAIIGRFTAVDTEVIADGPAADDVQQLPATAALPVAPAYPPGTEPGALQYLPHEDSHYFGTQDADGPPAGMTFRETMGAALLWPGADDVAPAPGGRTATGDGAQTRGGAAPDDDPERAWNYAEPGLRADWEARHPGRLSAWDTFREAIRHGWQRAGAGLDHGSGDDDARRAGTAADPAADRRDRYWQDVESDLADHREHMPDDAAPSAWIRMKAAVRHGWERVRH